VFYWSNIHTLLSRSLQQSSLKLKPCYEVNHLWISLLWNSVLSSGLLRTWSFRNILLWSSVLWMCSTIKYSSLIWKLPFITWSILQGNRWVQIASENRLAMPAGLTFPNAATQINSIPAIEPGQCWPDILRDWLTSALMRQCTDCQ